MTLVIIVDKSLIIILLEFNNINIVIYIIFCTNKNLSKSIMTILSGQNNILYNIIGRI